MSASELPKPEKIAFKTNNNYTKEPSEVAQLVEPGVEPEWCFLQKLVETYIIRWILQVDQVAAEAIKQADFGAYKGLDRRIFKILHDPNKPRESN